MLAFRCIDFMQPMALVPISLLQVSDDVAMEGEGDCQKRVDNQHDIKMATNSHPLHGQERLAQRMTQQLVVTFRSHLLEDAHLTAFPENNINLPKVRTTFKTNLTCLLFAYH